MENIEGPTRRRYSARGFAPVTYCPLSMFS